MYSGDKNEFCFLLYVHIQNLSVAEEGEKCETSESHTFKSIILVRTVAIIKVTKYY